MCIRDRAGWVCAKVGIACLNRFDFATEGFDSIFVVGLALLAYEMCIRDRSFVVKAPFFAGAESKEKGNPCYFQILMLLYYYKSVSYTHLDSLFLSWD